MAAIHNRIKRFFDGVEKLNSFEKTDDLAAFFRDLGYKGHCHRAEDCIVARFLRDCVGDPDATVTATSWDAGYIWADKTGATRGAIRLGTSTPVEKFVLAFDDGEYPDLTEPKPQRFPVYVP